KPSPPRGDARSAQAPRARRDGTTERPAAVNNPLELFTERNLLPPAPGSQGRRSSQRLVLAHFRGRGFWTSLCPGTVGGTSSRWRGAASPARSRFAVPSGLMPDLAGVQGQLSVTATARPLYEGTKRNVCALSPPEAGNAGVRKC